jgi:hypothetical protein
MISCRSDLYGMAEYIVGAMYFGIPFLTILYTIILKPPSVFHSLWSRDLPDGTMAPIALSVVDLFIMAFGLKLAQDLQNDFLLFCMIIYSLTCCIKFFWITNYYFGLDNAKAR